MPSSHSSVLRAASRPRDGCAHALALHVSGAQLLPYATEGDNVDPELVERMEAEVRELTGVGLEDLLNPSKVVNYERERLLLEAELANTALDAARRDEAQTRLTKVTKELYAEKRTVFRGWLKGVFIGQALLAIALGGLAAFDAFPVYTIDISLRALGFWSFWLFVIPSLRARRPKGWEKVREPPPPSLPAAPAARRGERAAQCLWPPTRPRPCRPLLIPSRRQPPSCFPCARSRPRCCCARCLCATRARARPCAHSWPSIMPSSAPP